MAQPHTKLSLAVAILLMPVMASAVEFRSVSVPKAVVYDAPSAQGKKTYILSQGYPVEVIVNLGEWLKVRDAQGGLNWIEAKQLANKRTVLVKGGQADIRQAADAASALLGKADKDVVLDMLESPVNGWVKVKHRDGITGYISASSLWGF
ncbi:SH3 domain-containing protein [Methylobacillus flagellatus]|uniref:SH3 domain-containing protein n=1 Tax=Methylobacillus flagellatus TaxID=405 RepID=UPI002853878C|nr:SH3 domain-containing protein [Methylobacillus flagellatus]MDR5172427.1 SH3 domain-containing protein [Methylobacillus flagellatus]